MGFDLYKRRMKSQGNSIGQIHKNNSDLIMKLSWDRDVQSKTCYIYDYFRDDQPLINHHMTYEHTTKTKIKAKFIISSYGSIDKDQVAYHLMFHPDQSVEFTSNDELYYFETDYRNKYNIHFPIGMFVDIPDDQDVYYKWLICDYEEANQFVKYVILPCDYLLQWISVEGNQRVKRQMWCCTRSLNSYNSGLWIDKLINNLDDLNRVLLPLNSITENLSYVDGEEENQRIIISAKTPKPLTWGVSKVENTKPIGIIRLSFKQDQFDPHKDYIERDSDGNIVGMWANYFQSEITPVDPNSTDPEVITSKKLHCVLLSSTNSIKVGGSYKLLTVNIVDEDNFDVTSGYATSDFNWTCFIDEEDFTESDLVKWLEQDTFNKIKIKFGNDRSYLNKLLTVRCTVDNIIVGEIQLELIV